jgi:glycopeptide antibiotics resistance protein
MGKSDVQVIVVRKWVTFVLVLLATAAIAFLIYSLSGRAYAGQNPGRELLIRIFSSPRPISRGALLALSMPILANILLFVPWGFLIFLLLDSPRRRRSNTYLTTFVAGILFAAALQIWQGTMPAPVTNLSDAAANALGALAGGALGHLRKEVRVRFR